MKVLGIIVEYNPFHKGHLYHIKKAKEVTSSDYVVCIMSGNFVQRGEPAIINKWARTEVALNYEIDLVIELPFVFSMSSAEYFSLSAIKILDSLGIVDFICFGSESGNIKTLNKIADILVNESNKFSKILKFHLSKGISYPSARQKTLSEFFNINLSKEITSPNNILGIEYLKALKKLKSTIKPFTISRLGNSYNDEKLSGALSSASSIRKVLNDNTISIDSKLIKIENSIPEKSLSIIKREFENNLCPVNTKFYDNIIISLIRRYSNAELKNIPYISEGLENKFKKNSNLFSSIDQVIKHTKSKRYTYSRLQRTIFNIMIGVNYNDFNLFQDIKSPIYARILGFNNNGIKLLLRIKNNSIIPTSTKFSKFYNSCNSTINKIAYYDRLSTDLYVLGYKNPDHKKSGQDFTNKFIRS